MPHKGFITPRTDPEWFLYYLFNDPDFIAEKLKIFKSLKQIYDNKYSVILMIFNNGAKLTAELSKTASGKNCLTLIKKTSIRFEVPTFVIEASLRYSKHLPIFPKKQPHIMTNGEVVGENLIAIELTVYTTIKDIEAIWFIVKEKQKGIRKKLNLRSSQAQGGENPKLIYAIYKQRLKNNNGKRKTYAEIFRLYQNDELPGYDGSNNQYKSIESIKRYYYTHGPKWDGFQR